MKKSGAGFPKKSRGDAKEDRSGKLSGAWLVLTWTLQGLSALILLQTLFFKFSGAEESKYIFTQMGMEPWGRYGTGVMELIASALLLVPRTVLYGAILAGGLMFGAVIGHLTRFGIEVGGDHGLLFGLAVTVLAASAAILFLNRQGMRGWTKRFFLTGSQKKRSD